MDSTVMRTHQDAAGARRTPLLPPGAEAFRAVASRYDKRGYFLGTVTLAALAIWLRT